MPSTISTAPASKFEPMDCAPRAIRPVATTCRETFNVVFEFIIVEMNWGKHSGDVLKNTKFYFPHHTKRWPKSTSSYIIHKSGVENNLDCPLFWTKIESGGHMREETRHCPYCKKETKQIYQEWGVTFEIWACRVCSLLNWIPK